MTALRSFAAAFCTVCVLTGGLYLLCPADRTEKAVRYVFGLIFVLCLLSVFPGLKQADFSALSQPPPVTESQIGSTAARQTFELALQRAGIEFSKITVYTDNPTADSIDITRVTVYTSADPDTVRELLGGDGATYEIEVIADGMEG